MTEWAVGFLLDGPGRVVLIRKHRPVWQVGKLNGVGGKVEPGETPLEAMRREFREEAGVDIDNWEPLLTLEWTDGLVHFFRAFAETDVLLTVSTQTDEPIEIWWRDKLDHSTVPNLRWLIPLAAHDRDRYEPFRVRELVGHHQAGVTDG